MRGALMRNLILWTIGTGLPSWFIIFTLADRFLWRHAKFHLLLSIPILALLFFSRYSSETGDIFTVPQKNNDSDKN